MTKPDPQAAAIWLMTWREECGAGCFWQSDGVYRLQDWSRCPDCKGSGHKHPLRRECPGTVDNPVFPAYHDGKGREACGCQGHKFLPVHDWDTIEAAIWARGWSLYLHAYPNRNGDWVCVFGPDLREDGITLAKDGLRGTAALQVAAARATGWEG